jgi:hypothetical protein
MQPYSSTGVGMSLMGLADIKARPPDVRFTPESRHQFSALECPLCADFVAEVGDDRSWRLVRAC